MSCAVAPVLIATFRIDVPLQSLEVEHRSTRTKYLTIANCHRPPLAGTTMREERNHTVGFGPIGHHSIKFLPISMFPTARSREINFNRWSVDTQCRGLLNRRVTGHEATRKNELLAGAAFLRHFLGDLVTVSL